MLEQVTGRIVFAVIYVRSTEIKAIYSTAIGNKSVRGMIVGLVEYVAAVDIVLVVLCNGVHRCAPH